MTFFNVLWFFLIFVLIGGYFVLDGFDLGAGALYPFVAKDDREKAVVRRSIGPVWDGNEVWLLTAGGALFAAFAPAYATTFSGFYLAVMLVLFGLIVRAVSLEYRGHDKKYGKVWDGCFFVGSLLPALLLGVAVGNIYAGIPMDMNGDYVGVPLLGLITPFTLLCGLLGLAMFMAAGAAWIALKAPKPSALQARAAGLRLPLQVAALVLFLAVSVYGHFVIQPAMDPARRGQRQGRVPRAVGVGVLPGGASGRLDVPEPRGGVGRQRGPVHHAHERRVVRALAHVDDHHHVRGPAAGAGVPRDHLPHVPRAHRGRRPGASRIEGRPDLRVGLTLL